MSALRARSLRLRQHTMSDRRVLTREEAGLELRAARLQLRMSATTLAEMAETTRAGVWQAENAGSASLHLMNRLRRAVNLPPLDGLEGGYRRGGRVEDRDLTGYAALSAEQRHEWATIWSNTADPHWQFPDKRKAEPNVDPVQGEFFAPEGIVEALVRESIQNSLDAESGSGPVRVRFGLYRGDAALPATTYGRYLAGLGRHLVALDDLPLPEPRSPMPVLVVEDFGTTGLTGDYRQHRDAGEERNNFYYFWRNIGRSRKSEIDRGRWGLGKTVFPASSRINSFFGLTIREHDLQPLLMGQSVLKIHTIDDGDYTPYGGYGVFDDEQFVLPVTDEDFIADFCRDFHVSRTSEAGFSAVIPFFRSEELELRDLIVAAIEHYFYPILAGSLELEFEEGERSERITSETIDSIVDRYIDTGTKSMSRDKAKAMFALARWALSSDHPCEIHVPDSFAPDWDRLEMDEEAHQALRMQFESGQPVHLRFLIRTATRDGAVSQMSPFDVYAERDLTADKRERHFVRRGITVPNKDTGRTGGARGLVVIEDRFLSTILGDAENPAHTEWNERSTTAREKYLDAVKTIRFVKWSFERVLTLLNRPPEGMEEDLLADVFSVTIADDAQSAAALKTRPKRAKGATPVPDISIKPNRLPAITVSEIRNGFTVKPSGKRECAGRRLLVRTAYEIGAGDPFKKYERYDFELNRPPISVQMVGLTQGGVEGNEAEFIVEDENFLLSVTGFDPNRDLVVRAEMIDGGGR